MKPAIGRIGIWHRWDEIGHSLVQEVERLGYGTVWIGGLPAGRLHYVEDLLAATERVVVATGIVNMWGDPPAEVAALHGRLAAEYPGRFLLGLGIGHPEAISQYRSPLQTANDYLDVLDTAGVPESGRVLAALGPRMLELAATRAAGAHPYLTTPEHTGTARAILGPNAMLAPEQKVLVGNDIDDARIVARRAVEGRLRRSNYQKHLARIGWAESDVARGGSDRLIDALVAHGSLDSVVERIGAHFDAGADHVAIQALGPNALGTYRDLAALLI